MPQYEPEVVRSRRWVQKWKGLRSLSVVCTLESCSGKVKVEAPIRDCRCQWLQIAGVAAEKGRENAKTS